MEEVIVERAIAWALERVGSADYALRCLAFVEDAYEQPNGIEIFGGSSARESADLYQCAAATGETMAYVKLGIGLAIAPRSVVPPIAEPAVAVPLSGFPELQIVLAWHETGYRTPAAEKALAFARAVGSEATV